MRLNERFTEIADQISEKVGRWWFTAASLLVLALWVLYGLVLIRGSGWFTSTEWNFPLNTVTTVGEWFLGALIAAAANRVERRNQTVLDQQTEMLAHNKLLHEQQLAILERLDQLVTREVQEVDQIEAEIREQVTQKRRPTRERRERNTE